jgi:hypothetical protein
LPKVTPKEVAEWMLEELKRVNFLYQDTVVYQISEKFGEEYTYTNQNGNLAIDRVVLKEFRKLTGDTVIWERGERLWRFREDYDEEGRRQT